MVAPDDTTYRLSDGRPFAPKGAEWDKLPWPSGAACRARRALSSTATSASTRARIAPMVTWGTSPEDARPSQRASPSRRRLRTSKEGQHGARARVHGPGAGHAAASMAVDRVFIGSCTNSRIEDLRAAAKVVEGRKAVIPSWVVAGSGLVKKQAEAEGLDRMFRAAGFEWRAPGCSMCVGMNGDTASPASASPRPRTATSSAVRAAACARTSSARPWRRPPPSPATSPTCADCSARRHHDGTLHHPRGAGDPDRPAQVDTDQIIPARFLGRPRPEQADGICSTTCATTPTASPAPNSS